MYKPSVKTKVKILLNRISIVVIVISTILGIFYWRYLFIPIIILLCYFFGVFLCKMFAHKRSRNPKWIKLLPTHLKPNKRQIWELEDIRAMFGISNKLFAKFILTLPTAVREEIRYRFEYLRTLNPEKSDKELCIMILLTLFSDPNRLSQAFNSINTLDDLCNYITTLTEYPPDPWGVMKEMDKILAQEGVDNCKK